MMNVFSSHAFSETGNEEVLENVAIIEDYLFGVKVSNNGTHVIVEPSNEAISIYLNDHLECREECIAQ